MKYLSRSLATALCSFGIVTGLSVSAPATAGNEVNIYSYRQPYLTAPLFDTFTKQTGITVNVIFAKKGLIERVKTEGANSPADIVLTTDIGRLTSAVDQGISQAVQDETLSKNIPAEYRDPKGHWFGLTRRARVVFASKARVKADAVSYEGLADPKWKGKICVRSGHHVYNVALFASMIAHLGPKKAESWLTGFKNNLARRPSGNDRAQVKGVFAGECDIALGNTYYMAKMQLNDKKPIQKEWAASVKILFPAMTKNGTSAAHSGADAGTGTHVNLSGMVLAKHAPHKANALKLMAFLSGRDAQKIYAEVNHEYPVKDGIAWSDQVKSWGTFKPDSLTLSDIAKLRKAASILVDKTSFNNGPSS